MFQLKERISLRKHHDERLSLRSQMGVDEAERRLIDDIKAEEKEKAEVGLYCSKTRSRDKTKSVL